MNAHNLNVFIFSNNAHCEGRGVDAARLLNYFTANGCRILDKPDQADFIIIFTCAFSNAFEDYYLDLIRRFQLHTYKGEIIVTGCLPAIAPEKLARLFQGKAFATCELHTIDKVFPWFETGYAQVPDANVCYYSTFSLAAPAPVKIEKLLNFSQKALARFELSGTFFRKGLSYLKNETINRYRRYTSPAALPVPEKQKLHGIRISTGCQGNCSYCGIRKAIGKLHSKPPESCLDEYRQLLEQGHRQIVIGSEDTGAYGRDVDSSLPELLDRMSRIDARYDTRWYLTSLKPVWLIKYKTQLVQLAGTGRISHLECPVQSGSERVLNLMNRPSDLGLLTDALLSIKQAAPGIKLSTHVIVGFPSETHADFMATMDLLKRLAFRTILVNPYDDKTLAASIQMDDKVAENTIVKRCAIVQAYMKQNGVDAFRPRITCN